MKTMNRLTVLVVTVFLFTALQIRAYFDPTIGKWASRDPVAEPGSMLLRDPGRYSALAGADPILGIDLGMLVRDATRQTVSDEEIQLYAFNRNDGINFVDAQGLMRIQDLLAKLQARKQANASIECCCVSPKISGSIAGTSQGGGSVLGYYSKDFTDIFFFDKCVFAPEIYWWDCYSASEEGGWSWNWQDYGWGGPGSWNYQKTAFPSPWSMRDPYHLAMLSLYVWDECVNGKRSTQWKASNGLQWTWDKKAKQWTGPEQVKK